ncbi:conserved hypothetical protein [delta proteobacterium NaphS2]|nr:conserved hypothetical protein [delta proteobacterium NaphS2]
MNKKTVFILLVVLAILAAVGRSILIRNSTPAGGDIMGSPLFTDFPANDIASVVIERPDDSVALVKDESGWIVESRFGYPADFSKLTDLIRKLKETKVGRKFPATESIKKRLSLAPPDYEKTDESEKATRVLMKDKKGTVLVDILLGVTRKPEEKGIADSQFVMPGSGPDIYLVDQVFTPFAVGASAWLKKSPVKVAEADIRKITCTGPDGTVRYIFERPEKGKAFELTSPPAKRAVEASSLNRLVGALTGLEIQDVADPATPPESLSQGISPRLDYTLFNGITYHVYPGLTCSPGLPCHLRLQVDFTPPADRTTSKEGGEASKKDKERAAEKIDGAPAAEAASLNARLSPWFFVVPQWQHEAFFTTLGHMLEEEKKS